MTAKAGMVLLLAASSPGVWAGTLDLAVRGRAPEYKIVHAADASPSVKYAARAERLPTSRTPVLRANRLRGSGSS